MPNVSVCKNFVDINLFLQELRNGQIITDIEGNSSFVFSLSAEEAKQKLREDEGKSIKLSRSIFYFQGYNKGYEDGYVDCVAETEKEKREDAEVERLQLKLF